MQTHPPKASWQQELIDSVTTLDELLNLLRLPPDTAESKSCLSFPLRVPKDYLSRIEIGNPNDPLLLQVLPQGQELNTRTGYSLDPLKEKEAIKIPGLLHKYSGRVLIITTGACAINCRYCFRRHFPYPENRFIQNLSKIIDYIAEDKTIYEVILSGGDPLMLKDEILKSHINALSEIPHLQYLRFHTRLPIMIPSRITEHFMEILTNTRLKTTLVFHCNHPQELSLTVKQALKKFSSLPIQLLNQAVLLKDVNDRTETLENLSHELYSCGVLPYYLHFLDPVEGVAHFEVPRPRALKLIEQLRKRLPGYLVPKLVEEIAGAPYKIPI